MSKLNEAQQELKAIDRAIADYIKQERWLKAKALYELRRDENNLHAPEDPLMPEIIKPDRAVADLAAAQLKIQTLTGLRRQVITKLDIEKKRGDRRA